MNAATTKDDWLTISTKITSYIIVPITMCLLILSLYCGWKANGVLTGQLLTKKALEVIVDPVILLKFNKYGFFQFSYFVIAIGSLGLCFIFRLLSLITKDGIKRPAPWLTILAICLICLVVTYFLRDKCQEYNKGISQVIIKQKEKTSSSQASTSTQKDKKLSDTLLKELINASRDITKLLMNWAILLLTGLGYVIIRIMKFIE